MSHLLAQADAARMPLADASVDLIVCSPPYFALRSYRDNGEHYDGQIGSEPTPQAFLEALWAVMTECWRVLKPTGSCFVNLGDKRAGSGGHNNSGVSKHGEARGPKRYTAVHARGRNGAPPLWTQQGAAWLAGVIDCDGCIHVGRPRADVASARANLVVEMGDREVCDRVASLTGVGNLRFTGNGTWRWEATGPQAGYVLERIWPWLLIKQRQALAAIEMCRLKEANYGRNVVGSDELEYRARIAEAIADWNQRRPNDWVPPRRPVLPLPLYEWAARSKSKLLLPHRFAIGCEDGLADPEGRGWIVRSDICWSKLNSLPESVTDRCRDSHEYLFHLTKEGRYFSAVDEVREAHAEHTLRYNGPGTASAQRPANAESNAQNGTNHVLTTVGSLGKLPGSVWPLASEPLVISEAVKAHYDLPDHFAAFPTELVRRVVLGWSPSGVCVACGEGRRPVVAKELETDHHAVRTNGGRRDNRDDGRQDLGQFGKGATHIAREIATITGYACACPDDSAPTRPAVVLDPFSGTATTVGTARALGRIGVGLDLSMDYCRLGRYFVERSSRFAKVAQRTHKENQAEMFAAI